VLRNVVDKKDTLGWGPNAVFRFPVYGGTGSIWKALYNKLPSERVFLGKKVTSVDVAKRTIHFSDGSSDQYDRWISTLPLDTLLLMIRHDDASDPEKFSKYAKDFVHSSTHVVGIGLEGPQPEELKTKCWMYFPESDCNFYRVTVFSNHSPNNVPNQERGQWSLICEVSERYPKVVDHDTIIEECIQGCFNTKLISSENTIVSKWKKRLEHGYPTPFVGRDELLGKVQPLIRKENILSRGRFGGWKYEVGNQDHSMMQGVEAVDAALFGAEEITYFYPNVANAKKTLARTES